MTEKEIVLEPRAALELLGKLTEGRSLIEAHALAMTIKVRKPSKDESPEQDNEQEEPGNAGPTQGCRSRSGSEPLWRGRLSHQDGCEVRQR